MAVPKNRTRKLCVQSPTGPLTDGVTPPHKDRSVSSEPKSDNTYH